MFENVSDYYGILKSRRQEFISTLIPEINKESAGPLLESAKKKRSSPNEDQRLPACFRLETDKLIEEIHKVYRWHQTRGYSGKFLRIKHIKS